MTDSKQVDGLDNTGMNVNVGHIKASKNCLFFSLNVDV